MALLVILTATACGRGGVKISPAALDEFRTTTRLSVPDTLELSDDALSRLARQGSVDESVIRDVAPQLDSQPLWKSSLTTLREGIGLVPEEVRAGSISILCDFIQGDITSPEEFEAALIEEFGSMTEPEAISVMSSLSTYASDMGAALRAGDKLAASVVLTCYIAEQSA